MIKKDPDTGQTYVDGVNAGPPPIRYPEDPVSSPNHYNSSGIECIEAIRASLTPAEFQGYCKGNTMKYNWRHRIKNGLEDCKKAQVYQGWLIESLEENEE